MSFVFCFVLSLLPVLLCSFGISCASPFVESFFWCDILDVDACCSYAVQFLNRTGCYWFFCRWMFYSLSFVGGNVAFAVRSVIVNLLLFLPLLLAVGLLPQIRTFVMFVLEQSCMMLFGSNGTFSLWAAMVEVVKGCFCWILLVLVRASFLGSSEMRIF